MKKEVLKHAMVDGVISGGELCLLAISGAVILCFGFFVYNPYFFLFWIFNLWSEVEEMRRKEAEKDADGEEDE